MSTLAEIEQAAETLPPEQQQELLLFLATRLHGKGGALPPPRDIPREQIEKWIADDEGGHRRFLAVQERLADADDLLELRKAKRAEGRQNPSCSQR